MVDRVVRLKLRSGGKMPIVGFGTSKFRPGETAASVQAALLAGYRHLDCAYLYQNEAEVGQGLRAAIEVSNGTLRREDVFITTKIWSSFQSYKGAKVCLQTSLERLKLDYADLCLIHTPMGYAEGKEELFPKDENGKLIFSGVHFLETWQALEELKAEGKTRSIGVSNFNMSQLKLLLDNCKEPPEVLQVERHPYFHQEQLLELCRSRGVVFVAHSPLGSPARPWARPDDPTLLHDLVLHEIGQKYNKTAAQIALKWNVQQGVPVIPKSANVARIQENIDLFDFELSEQDMERIKALDQNLATLHFEWTKDHPLCPLTDEAK